MATATASAKPGDREDPLDTEAASLPAGADAMELPQCDLVMKGGITSGVVYPGAVIALAKKFRFAALGGTSAGAIAAGVCAAGEYGRIHGNGKATGLTQLRVVSKQLGEPGVLTGLFQATDDAKPLMDLALLPADHPDDSHWRRMGRLALAALKRVPLVWLTGAVVVAAFVALVVGAFQGMSPVLAIVVTLLAGIPFLALVSMGMVAAAFGLPARRAMRSLPESHYGMCPGTNQPGYAEGQAALTPWLHGHIQAASGLDRDDPAKVLTVADLKGDDEATAIGFETMTTDLSRARPLRCPADLAAYSFKESELRALFPDPVVTRMVEDARKVEDAHKVDSASNEYLRVNAERLPVLVAIRLSLSFPGLLSAVPLYQRVGGKYRRSLFSDGGIASNFPVHFFDAWFPRRPTFGIDLGPQPEKDAPLVVLHGQDGLGGYREVNGLAAFGGQIKDTMQNWRDNLQTELQGYRERVCEVRFMEGEGGLNLKMAPPKVQALMERGFEAGEKLSNALPMTVPPAAPSPQWLNHCKVRFDTLMWLQQEGLGKFHERSEVFLTALEAGGLTPPDRKTWADAAVAQTKKLLDCAEQWGPPPKDVDFTPTPPFEPEPVMRVVPKA